MKWVYIKDGSVSEGDDAGWVDLVEWSGAPGPPAPPTMPPANWSTANYTYDPSGRRIKKEVDGFIAHYTYDGGNVLAEYADNGDLLRKYLYGPGIDEPISMTEVVDSNAVYYYHTDGLGSVIALTDATGNSVQTYEYSIYGLGAASDPNHTNPYMFAGRRFDVETGLYFNRARFYNPYIGRFMQTDPIGYGDGMNWYAYTGNNPANFVDPSGTTLVLPSPRVILNPQGYANHLVTVYALALWKNDTLGQVSFVATGDGGSDAIFWEGSVSLRFLMGWYLFGGGKPLFLRGDPVDTLLAEDTTFMPGLVSEIVGKIVLHRAGKHPSSFSFSKPLTFDKRDGGAHWALGGAHGDASIVGQIMTYEGENGGTRYRAEFTVRWNDVGDLHQYTADKVASYFERRYNDTFSRYFGVKAQAFGLDLKSSVLGVTLEWNSKGDRTVYPGFSVIHRWTLDQWDQLGE